MQNSEQTWPDDAWLPKASLMRVVAAIIAQEVAANRRQDVHQLRPDLWDEGAQLLEEGLALDSLERMNCASALNRFFHLSDYGAEDYLLGAQTLGDWAYVVAVSIANGSQQLTFQTSGTTGTPKLCTHRVSDLMEETKAWAAHFAGAESIVAMVSPQHIYGFIWTVLLPQCLGAEVVDARFLAVAKIKALFEARAALAVASPPYWQYLARSGLAFPGSLRAVTSTAPISPDLVQQLKAQGLYHLTHIYGSSETGGVGWRQEPDTAYQLLPYWHLCEGRRATALARTDGRTAPLMDRLAVYEDGRFDVLGRRDGAVQVGGLNVHPSRIEDVLRTSSVVKECCVHLCEQSQRLTAEIVPRENANARDVEAQLRAFCLDALPPAERPASYRLIHQP
ncbi:MAG: AMP-binding protein [Pseudomonadota bacterium]